MHLYYYYCYYYYYYYIRLASGKSINVGPRNAEKIWGPTVS